MNSVDVLAGLSEGQVQQFRDDGYVVIPDFFTIREVAAMVAELERFKREGLGRNVATDGDGTTHSTRQVNYQIIPLNDKSTLFRALPFHPKVKRAVSQLIGDPFLRQLDQIFLKPAKSGAGTSWHTDNAYFKIADPTMGTGMWIALHDATVANGTLRVIPRSHLQTFEHYRDMGSDHHIRFDADESRAVPIEIPAGGTIFFNYGVAHCTKANTTDKERAGLAYHFVRREVAPLPKDWGLKKEWIHVTGPDASGGEREYGVRVEGAWESEVGQRIGNE